MVKLFRSSTYISALRFYKEPTWDILQKAELLILHHKKPFFSLVKLDFATMEPKISSACEVARPLACLLSQHMLLLLVELVLALLDLRFHFMSNTPLIGVLILFVCV